MRQNTPEDPLLPERDSLAQSDKFEEENVDDKAAMGGLSGILSEEIGLKKEAVLLELFVSTSTLWKL